MVVTTTALDELGAFVSTASIDRIPDEVQTHAKLVLLDTIGVMLAASLEADSTALAATVLAEEPGSSATLFRRGFQTTSTTGAAFVNGTTCVALEMDEGHRYYGTHAASHVLPAALAVAEQIGASGRDLIAALVVGYDVAARMGGAKHAHPWVNGHGAWPTVGAAAACARLLGLSAIETTTALRLASHLSLAASLRTTFEGATIRNAYVGMAAQAGIRAVQLARAGYRGLADAPEEVFGRILGDGFDSDVLVEELGTRYEITRNFFKLYACCHYNHAALQALEALVARTPFAWDDVRKIEVRTFGPAAQMSTTSPVSTLHAKFSVPFALAVRLVKGDAGVAAFSSATLVDARVLELAKRVRLLADPQMTAAFPTGRSAEVSVQLQDGRALTELCVNARGDHLDPHPQSAIFDKFRVLARSVISAPAVDKVMNNIMQIERMELREGLVSVLRAG